MHYLTDVIGGMVVGVIAGWVEYGFFTVILRKVKQINQNQEEER